MDKKITYRVRNIGLMLSLGFALSVPTAHAQKTITGPTSADMYCSGLVTNKDVPRDTYVITGENSSYKTTFNPSDYVYINRGARQGVKVGDEFEVLRPVHDTGNIPWFKYQTTLSRAMGQTYADIGRLRVVRVDERTSIAETSLACEIMWRGDIVRPFEPRPAPLFHQEKFDAFAMPSGKKMAMVVNAKYYGALTGLGSIVYVNLGSGQGVNVGDYFRVFRYQGTRHETLYQMTFLMEDTTTKVYGFGGAPAAYHWNDLPRQNLGEGIVLRTGPNSSTVLLTTVREEIYTGDYVELE